MATLLPPVFVVYHETVPELEVAFNVTVPDPQLEFGLVLTILGVKLYTPVKGFVVL